jgi:hypothetical protein
MCRRHTNYIPLGIFQDFFQKFETDVDLGKKEEAKRNY